MKRWWQERQLMAQVPVELYHEKLGFLRALNEVVNSNEYRMAVAGVYPLLLNQLAHMRLERPSLLYRTVNRINRWFARRADERCMRRKALRWAAREIQS